VQQELHHVGLGEELSDRRQLLGTDLRLRLVDLLLPLRLPELVDPAERVRCTEDLRGKSREKLLELHPVLAGERDLQRGVVGPEHLREHPLGETAGEGPRIGALLAGEVLTLGDADRDLRLRLDQEIALGEESGEEHPVPVLVGALVDEMVDGLVTGAGVAPVAELAPVSAKAGAQRALLGRHVTEGLAVTHGEGLECRPRAGLGDLARLDDSALEPPAQIDWQCAAHDVAGGCIGLEPFS